MKRIMLSILVLGAFIPLTNGAFAESSTAPHSTHLLKHALKISPPSKFSVTYVGSRSTQSPTPSQPDAYECLSQLLENIYDEQSHISELKALLTTCPDKASHEARNLCHKIMESLRIVDTYNDYLVSLMCIRTDSKKAFSKKPNKTVCGMLNLSYTKAVISTSPDL